MLSNIPPISSHRKISRTQNAKSGLPKTGAVAASVYWRGRGESEGGLGGSGSELCACESGHLYIICSGSGAAAQAARAGRRRNTHHARERAHTASIDSAESVLCARGSSGWLAASAPLSLFYPAYPFGVQLAESGMEGE